MAKVSIGESNGCWLEVFGNQWGTRQFGGEPMTPEENQHLLDALNPFAK